jgi:hypothetical protein
MHEEPSMTATAPQSPARRTLLVSSAVGAAAAAFLAACGTSSDSPSGASGDDPTPTGVAPTAPPPEASADDRAWDITVLRTAASLELLAADLYRTYAPFLSSGAWTEQAARYAADHRGAAAVFNRELTASRRVNEPNSFLQENSIDPIAQDLTSDTAILNMFAGVESSITATYITAVGTQSTSLRRELFALYAGAAARRNALLANGGTGAVPNQPLYPLRDLIPNDAYVVEESAATQADAAAAEGEDTAAEE